MFGFGKNKSTVSFPGPFYVVINEHRSSFLKRILEIEGRTPIEQDWEEVKNLKKIIFSGYLEALQNGIPATQTTFFIDEQTGSSIIEQAVEAGVTYCLAVEKSGQRLLDFEHGQEYVAHIEALKPVFIKALVRYNPRDPEADRMLQQGKLKEITAVAREHNTKLIIEVRIPATPEQMVQVDNDDRRYDLEIRPNLATQTVSELRAGGADPDIWHIEGFELPVHYENVVEQIQMNDRENVGMVIMSRGASFPQVESWLTVGAGVDGIIGFSVGRTAFQNAIKQFRAGEKGGEDGAHQIAQNFIHFYEIFTKARGN